MDYQRISMTVRSGLEPFKAFYDAADPGREELGFIDLGINSDVKMKTGSNVPVWMRQYPEG